MNSTLGLKLTWDGIDFQRYGPHSEWDHSLCLMVVGGLLWPIINSRRFFWLVFDCLKFSTLFAELLALCNYCFGIHFSANTFTGHLTLIWNEALSLYNQIFRLVFPTFATSAMPASFFYRHVFFISFHTIKIWLFLVVFFILSVENCLLLKNRSYREELSVGHFCAYPFNRKTIHNQKLSN